MANKYRKRTGIISVEVDVDVDVSDVIDQIDDQDLLDECIDRKLKVPLESKNDGFDFDRERIAFYFGKSRFAPISELMKLIQEKLESE